MPTAKTAKVKLTAAQRRALREQPEPSAKSLELAPEVRDAKYMGRGPEGLRAAIEYARAKRGRPRKGEVAAGSSPRSIRLPDATWEALEQRAKLQGATVHALLREAVADILSREVVELDKLLGESASAQSPRTRHKRKAG